MSCQILASLAKSTIVFGVHYVCAAWIQFLRRRRACAVCQASHEFSLWNNPAITECAHVGFGTAQVSPSVRFKLASKSSGFEVVPSGKAGCRIIPSCCAAIGNLGQYVETKLHWPHLLYKAGAWTVLTCCHSMLRQVPTMFANRFYAKSVRIFLWIICSKRVGACHNMGIPVTLETIPNSVSLILQQRNNICSKVAP